jgi:D-serine deaminase-like pyridoxal phosphate-dependent protein
MEESFIPTPALLVNDEAVERNLKRVAEHCARNGIRLRPHTKTHKSRFMADRQLKHGAAGLTVAKVGEAEALGREGDDLLVAYCYFDPARARQLAALAKTMRIHAAVDSIEAVDIIAQAAREAGVTIGLLVDMDLGFHRTGVASAEETLNVARHISKHKGVIAEGLFGFPGHLMMPREAQSKALAGISEMIRQAIGQWTRDGHKVSIVSGGSTPSAMFADEVKEWTEIRPGTYIYNDRNTLAGGWCKQEDCATTILATVVSTAVPNKCVIDAGSKTLTSDRLHADPMNAGFGLIVEYPQAKLVRLSEEHGEVDLNLSSKRPKLGERIHVIPNHICPCVNLQDGYWLKRADGSVERLTVDARGRVT